MENRIALIGIIVENEESVERLNRLLHDGFKLVRLRIRHVERYMYRRFIFALARAFNFADAFLVSDSGEAAGMLSALHIANGDGVALCHAERTRDMARVVACNFYNVILNVARRHKKSWHNYPFDLLIMIPSQSFSFSSRIMA